MTSCENQLWRDSPRFDFAPSKWYRSLRTRTYFRLSLVSVENNVCETELGNDFCHVMTSVSLWPIRFHNRMKIECSSQRIPRTVVLGLLELSCDWLKIPTSQKSFPGSGSQTLFSTETSVSQKCICFRRLVVSKVFGWILIHRNWSINLHYCGNYTLAPN